MNNPVFRKKFLLLSLEMERRSKEVLSDISNHPKGARLQNLIYVS